MKNLRAIIVIVAFALFATIPSAPSSTAAAVVSTFDTDLEGWLILGDNSGTWQSTGGNPGGCLAVNDLAVGQLNYAAAPAKFLGDWSAMTAADSLSFDVHLVQQSGTLIVGEWIFRIAGPGGAARGIVPGNAPPLNVWSAFAIPISAANWAIESGSWSAIVANVTSLRLLVEYVNGNEDVLVDNVRLTATPEPVFTPCVYSDFNGTGTDEWSFEGTGATSNPANGEGNGGGFLQVADNTSLAGYAFAPSRFLGDWTPLSGNGFVTVDVRVLSSSGTNLGSPQFIRLSGPGGVAHVSLSPADLPASEREWRTFTFPLDAGTWTVDSGTWAGLMADVGQFRVDTDFFSTGGTVGFDNVGRLRNDCPPIDDHVVVHDEGITRCDRHSLIGVTGVAFNPANDVLHGLVRDDGTRDGVYMIDGATPYAKLRTYDRPAALIFDGDGDGYVTEDYSGNVYRFVGASSSELWVSGFHANDDDPYGMTFAPAGFTVTGVAAGDILVADRGNGGPDEVWAFSPDVAENEVLASPDPGEVDWFDLTAGPDGTVWLCDALQANSLRVLSSTGVPGTLALGQPIAGLYSIVWDNVDSRLYVASGSADAVYRVNPATGAVTLVADGFGAISPAGLEILPVARRLWVTDSGTNRVYELCLPGVPSDAGKTPPVSGLALRAYPNPFNPSVRISFELDRAGEAVLQIFDVAGRRVRDVATGRLAAGEHAFGWNGRDDGGQPVASGVYFARLRHGGATATVRLVLVR